jgi:hypothetical protein
MKRPQLRSLDTYAETAARLAEPSFQAVTGAVCERGGSNRSGAIARFGARGTRARERERAQAHPFPREGETRGGYLLGVGSSPRARLSCPPSGFLTFVLSTRRGVRLRRLCRR